MTARAEPPRPYHAARSPRARAARPLVAIALLTVLGASSGVARAQQAFKLTASDASSSAGFGFSVDVDGDTAIVGANTEAGTATAAGAAYVFVRSGATWVQQAKLVAGDTAQGDHFGESVAIHGDHAVVGAPFADLVLGSDAGAAYVFARSGTTWSETAKLTTLFSNADDLFGTAVAIDGDRVAVGSPFGDGNDISAGAVYVYERSGTTWPNTGRVFSQNSTIGDRIGESVSLSGDTLATGALGDDVLAPFAGAAYVFRLSGTQWLEEVRLQAFDGTSGQTYGRAVAVDGDRLAVSASGDKDLGSLAGAVYMYERVGTTWTFDAKLTGATTTAGDQLGHRVALQGDVLAAGSFGDDAQGSNAGSVTVFRLLGSTWTEQLELFTDMAGPSDRLGRAVAVSGATVLGGAPFHDDPVNNAGAATAWELPPASVVTYCTGKTNSAGCVPFLSTSGLPSASSTGNFTLTGNDVVPGEAGFVLYGFKKANLAFHGGTLCVKVPFVRTPVKSAKNTGGGCSGWVLRRNFNATIQSGVDPALTAGRAVTAQYRQRDPTDASGFGDGLTDGVRFTILP